MKRWEIYETVHRLFIYLKVYESVRRELLYNIYIYIYIYILIEFGIPMKLVRLIGICLNESYSKVRIGKFLCDTSPIQNALKEDALQPLSFNFALDYAIREIQKPQVVLKLNGTHQLLAYADDVTVVRDNIDTTKTDTNFNWC
jgi:hypothetical protein